MKLDKNVLILILVGIVAFSIYSDSHSAPKQSVATVSGAACTVDEDCPCYGTYNGTTTLADPVAYGVGIASCEANKCDMTYCVDIKPVGEWMRDNPWKYLKNNPLVLFTFIALIAVALMWPKV